MGAIRNTVVCLGVSFLVCSPWSGISATVVAVPDWTLPANYAGLTIAPFSFIIKSEADNCALITHERWHVTQVARMGWLPFYVSYLYQFTRNYARTGNWQFSYSSISYEVEARQHEQKAIKNENIISC